MAKQSSCLASGSPPDQSAGGLVQALVVGRLHHKSCNVRAELPVQFLKRGIGILKRVMEQPGSDERRIFARRGERGCAVATIVGV
jgi:hypothetical protein